MMNLINAMPQVAQIIADLIVEAQDWPMADEIARRIRMTLPPGILNPKDVTPEMAQRAKSAGDAQQKQEQMQDAAFQAEQAKAASEVELNAARAHNFVVTADVAQNREQTNAMSEASQAADRELRGHLEAIHVAHGGGDGNGR
jgi:hypothetical protein